MVEEHVTREPLLKLYQGDEPSLGDCRLRIPSRRSGIVIERFTRVEHKSRGTSRLTWKEDSKAPTIRAALRLWGEEAGLDKENVPEDIAQLQRAWENFAATTNRVGHVLDALRPLLTGAAEVTIKREDAVWLYRLFDVEMPHPIIEAAEARGKRSTARAPKAPAVPGPVLPLDEEEEEEVLVATPTIVIEDDDEEELPAPVALVIEDDEEE